MADRDLRIRMLLEASDRFTRPVRDMASGSSKLAASLKATRDRLKDVERAQSDLAGFRSLKRGMADSEAAMRQAQARAAALGREIAQTEAPTRAMTRSFNAAKRQAAEMEQQHQRNSAQLGDLRQRLRDAGIATTDLVRHERRLRDEAAGLNRELSEQGRRMVTLNDRTRRLSEARAGFSRTMNAATGLAAGGAAAVGTGMALAAPVVSSVKAAQDYQSVITDIAQKANLTRREAEALGRQLLQNARDANQLPAAMQTGFDTLTGFGASVPQAVAMMRPIGRAATAYKAEIGDLAAATFAVSDNLKVPASQTTRVLEMMAAAGKAGAFEMKDMATYFPQITAAYQGLGQKGVNAAGDLAAALQITRKGAGSSEMAATNLANVLQKMASPDTIKNFEKFGVDLPAALKKAYAEGKTPIEAIAELTNKALGGDLSKLGYLFGDAQVQQGLRPLIQQMDEYRRIRAEAQGAGSVGTVDSDFATRMQDSAEQTRQLQVNAQALGVTLGSTLLPTVNRVLSRVNAFAGRLMAWSRANPGFAKGIAITGAVLAGLFIVLGAGAVALAGVMAPIAVINSGLIAMGVAGGVASVGLAPIIGIALAVVAAVAAVGYAAYLIYKNWDKIGSFFSSLWSGIVTVFTAGVGDIGRGLAYFAGYALGALSAFGPAAWNWFTGTLPGLLARGWNFAWNGLKAAFRAAFITLPALFFDFGAMIVQGLWNGIKSAPARLLAAGKSMAGSLASGFRAGAGIHSPSRVFAALGGHIIGGLNLGLDRAQGGAVDRIARLTRNMAAVVTIPALGSAAMAMAADGTRATQVGRTAGLAVRSSSRPASAPSGRAVAPLGPIQITVNGAPGQSADDLALAVRRVIEDMRRDDAARARSSFRDRQDQDSLD